jgi:hypothetical protein
MTIAMRAAGLVVLAAMLGSPASAAGDAAWNPPAWVDESTIELRTQAPGEDEHWFKVWFVVIDGQLYVRLGGRASTRFEENATRPVIAVRIAGQEFAQVDGVAAPEMADRVAAAMADKHWSDVFVRWLDHPLTLRLVPK